MPRPDFSQYVVHLTKESPPFGAKHHANDTELQTISSMSAYDRLVKILNDRTIRATPMPWTDRPAVAFSECPWGSLVDHARQYSAYGVGFTKPHLFAAGGGPAIYLRQDLLKEQNEHATPGFHPHLWSFITPFAPSYAPQTHLDDYWRERSPLDFTHEREWRVPHEFTFEYSQVQFVIVDTYEDVARFPTVLKDEIGRDRFLIMDVYRQIERLWPVHDV